MKTNNHFGVVVAVKAGALTVVGAPGPLSRIKDIFWTAAADGANTEVVIVSSAHGIVKRRKVAATRAAPKPKGTAGGRGKK
ncbi:MAG: hypothetical protein LBD30_07760 [Verrucomicrobiales bacterium]|jgi:hypothetical protein|nr:hypothetical protein [Verrucomicrobiales bacterium]